MYLYVYINFLFCKVFCFGVGRYQIEFGVSRSQAFRYYELALISKPEAGIPHNQLATLMGHNLWWGLHAAYHYFRAYVEYIF